MARVVFQLDAVGWRRALSGLPAAGVMDAIRLALSGQPAPEEDPDAAAAAVAEAWGKGAVKQIIPSQVSVGVRSEDIAYIA